MKDMYFDILILILVGWLVYDRMQQKKAAANTVVVVKQGPLSTADQVTALLNAG